MTQTKSPAAFGMHSLLGDEAAMHSLFGGYVAG
jgi:hypothetical protein